MKFNKSTRYALYAAQEMAVIKTPITVGQVADKYQIPEGALAKVFQNLVRGGLAHGVRGVGGGYVLAKDPSEITVLDIIAVFEPQTEKGSCVLQDGARPNCEITAGCKIRKLFNEVEDNARFTFASVTLDTLSR